MGEYLMFVVKFHPEHCIRQRLDDRCDYLDSVFFRQRLLPSVSHWRQDFFFVDDAEDFLSYILYRPHAIYLVINTQLLVKLDQRMRLFAISPEALQNQIFAIIGPMNE